MVKTMNLTLPTSWESVNIDKFQRIFKLDKDLTPLERNIKVLAILTDNSISTIKSIDLGDLKEMIHAIDWMGTIPPEPKEFPTVVRYNHNGRDIDFKILTEASKLNVGEMALLEAQSKDSNEDIVANLDKIIATFIKPVDKKIEIDFPTRASIFKNQMSVATAYPLAVFFWVVSNHSLNYIKLYFEEEALRQTKKLKETLNIKNVSDWPNSFNG